MATFCSCEESYSEISCVIVRGEVYAMATTSILPENGKTPRFGKIYMCENSEALFFRTSHNCKTSILSIIQDEITKNILFYVSFILVILCSPN